MKNIDWFETICGIIEILICIFLLYNSNDFSCVFSLLGGFHIGKGLFGGKD